MENKDVVFDCQKSYEALQSYITANEKFANEYIELQIALREDSTLTVEKHNRLNKIFEEINEIVITSLSQARMYYNLLLSRKDINFNNDSREEILKIWDVEGDKSV